MEPKGPLDVGRGSDLFSSQDRSKYFLMMSGALTSSMIVRMSSSLSRVSLAMFAQSLYPNPSQVTFALSLARSPEVSCCPKYVRKWLGTRVPMIGLVKSTHSVEERRSAWNMSPWVRLLSIVTLSIM